MGWGQGTILGVFALFDLMPCIENPLHQERCWQRLTLINRRKRDGAARKPSVEIGGQQGGLEEGHREPDKSEP